ncbi:MAG: energy transducer TonB [Candidatus Eisenbacteria sp.]|nr:energy transducer TonB [Candidatus Eisenbacteria bacterium]
MSTEIMQPQMTPEAINTEPVAGAPPAAAGAGVEEGVSGGVPGGTPGGVPGGVPGGLLWAGGDVSVPVVIHRVQPEYPMIARRARVEGEVRLEAVIRRDGTVGDIRVVQGLRLGCTEAAIEALKRWRFRPGERNGIPVDVYFALTVDFILN